MKICVCCNQNKNDIDFRSHRRNKDGLHSYCRECENRKKRERRNTEEHRAKRNEYNKRFRLNTENRNKLNQTAKKWRSNNKDAVRRSSRNASMKRSCGATIDVYDKKMIEQNGKCYICGRNGDDFSKGLVLDHNHVTGQIRDLLCPNCNSAIGFAKESEPVLANMIEYLKKWTKS